MDESQKLTGDYTFQGGYFPGIQITDGDPVRIWDGKEENTLQLCHSMGCTPISTFEFQEACEQDMFLPA